MAQVQTPKFFFPKFDLDAVFAMQRANLATVHEAQAVLVEAAQAIVRAQHGYAREFAERAAQAFTGKEPKKAETVIAGVKAEAERAAAVSKHNADLGFAAQRRVAELVTQRAQANLDELKALAA